VLVFLLSVLAENDVLAETSLGIGNSPGYPGATVSVPITLQKATNAVATQFDVAFNPAKVSAGDAAPGATFSDHLIRSREISPGVRRVLAYSRANSLFRSNTFSATMPFTVSPNERVSSGPITPNNAISAARDRTALEPVSLHSGTIFIAPVHRNPDGQVQFFLPSQPDERYLIQATTNFLDWVNLSTNVALGSFMDLVDMDAPNYPFRFYRSALFDAIVGGYVGSFTRAQDGSVNFRITGLEGRTYIIQASTNLVQWENISTNTAVSRPYPFHRPKRLQFSPALLSSGIGAVTALQLSASEARPHSL